MVTPHAFNQPTQLHFTLPDWLIPFVRQHAPVEPTDTDRMAFVLAVVREHIRQRTGGPFAAAIWNDRTGALVSVGVNRVPAEHSSWLHAEMLAIALAQQHTGHTHLSSAPHTLVTSTEPCAMCLGAIPWAGVQRVVTGARDQAARAIGFDEGCKPQPWPLGLQQRGIDVVTGVLQQQAEQVLCDYKESGGEGY